MKIFNLHHIAQSLLKFLFNMWNIHSSLWWILISRRQRRLGKRRCWNKIFIHRGITRHRIVWIPSSFKPDRIGWKGDSCWIPGHVQKAYSRQDWINFFLKIPNIYFGCIYERLFVCSNIKDWIMNFVQNYISFLYKSDWIISVLEFKDRYNREYLPNILRRKFPFYHPVFNVWL